MIEALEISDLLKRSEGLVRIVVRRVSFRKVQGIPRHLESVPIRFEDHIVRITQVLRQNAGIGLAPNSELVIRTIRADSEATFNSGEEALVFLSPLEINQLEFILSSNESSQSWTDAHVYRVFGGFQGKFTVENGLEGQSVSQPNTKPTPLTSFLANVSPLVQKTKAISVHKQHAAAPVIRKSIQERKAKPKVKLRLAR
jgi:hypothetical protein